MAFLKSSQITGLAPRDLDVRGFTQADSINLDGVYSEHEVLLADAYNIKGNVTVSEDLILSKLSDDGDDITITGDTTTRTISGSGSIQGATLAQTPNATLTGMTGEISSSVLSKATFEGTLNSSTTFSGDAGKMTAKAWCNFYGTGTVGIRTSFNVSSITDVDVGRWEVNYMTSPALYTAAVSAQGGSIVFIQVVNEDQNAGAGKCEIGNYRWDTGAWTDTGHLYVIVFGN